ncbi:CHASE3 domain-containing protein [Ramlibacter sp. MMS24-I3-19]|uniref:CHASE3 domain-containing protein n=1 Tax=Ramlibacter sp. MMS24-I3-19 TaxID=3416606 RepID=UPI003CFCE892
MAANRSKLVDGLAFISVLCFVLAGLALLEQVQSLASAAGWVAHTREVLQSLDRVTLDIRESEASQRGYLLTGHAMFLQTYEAASDSVHRDLDVLVRLTQDNPRHQATSSREQEDIDQAYSAGANSYIQKPVLFEKLAELSERLHTYWLLTNVVSSRPRA